LVLTELCLRVDYKHTDEETSKQLSDRHVAIGNAILTGNTVSDEQTFGCEGQCLHSAFETLREGMQNIDSLLILLLNLVQKMRWILSGMSSRE